MSLIINIKYSGENGMAEKFAKEMIESGTVDKIRKESGNISYEYYISLDDPNCLLLIDRWKDQESLDKHHASSMMETIKNLRDKYNLHMTVERFVEDRSDLGKGDGKFIRK